MGVVFQSPAVDPWLTVLENLRHHGYLYGLSGPALNRGIERSLERFGLSPRAADRVGALSGGLRRRVELAKALLPDAARVALLLNPASKESPNLKSIERTAKRLGMRIVPIRARNEDEIRKGFVEMTRKGADAVVITGDAFYAGEPTLLAELGIARRLPSIGWYRDHVRTGVLMSYGPDTAFLYRAAATYVDRILKGAKPGNLPIEQPTKIHLAINRRTAAALGITIPRELLSRANEVID